MCGCWEDISKNNLCRIIKFVHASRERNGDFDVCMCVLLADAIVAVLIFVRTRISKNSKYRDYMH